MGSGRVGLRLRNGRNSAVSGIYESLGLSRFKPAAALVLSGVHVVSDHPMNTATCGEHALIQVSAAPLHGGPSRRAEQVSQALLGEPVQILESRGGWRRVRTWDRYEGWVAAGALVAPPTDWDDPQLV